MDLLWIDILRLTAAIVAGTLIGLERELAAKPAGLRTNVLICLGAALFTLLSVRVAGADGIADRGRIAAQIVTGVGFLGAGAIIQTRRYVIGLTTAATIWAVASVGMAFGAGEFLVGALGTALSVGVLFGLAFLEARIADWRTIARFEVEFDRASDATDIIRNLAQQAGVEWKSWTINKTPTLLEARFKAVGPRRRLRKFQKALLRDDATMVVKRL